MSHLDLVSVTLVTYNSGRFIKKCLESVLAQKYPDLELIVIDNASTDGTIDILEQFEGRCRIEYNDTNIGFAAAQNQAISISRGEWVLTLNPDVLLMPGFIQQLVEAGQIHPRIGAVCGKLLTIKSTFELPEKAMIDSTGMYFTPMLRHLDRGSQQPDNGEYSNFEYVFGATAAAALYRRGMIDDVSLKGELLGWRCLYTPYARAYHVRNVLPGNRRALPAEINMHSVKNRFLMRIKNITFDLYRRNWFSITVRDLVVVSACLLREHSSLKAFWKVACSWGRLMEKREEIMRRRKVTDEYMASWFHPQPVSHPAPKPSPRVLARLKAARG
jgi:GT2 family glycosyltransferase